MKSNFFFLVMIILLLVGCQYESSSEKENSSSDDDKVNKASANYTEVNYADFETTTTNEKDQVFHIISAYKWINQYVQEAEGEKSERERSKLWRNIVMENIQDQCLSGEYSHLVADYVSTPPKNLKRLKKNIELLNSSNLEEEAMEALEVSAEAFPGSETTICLLPHQDEVHLLGVNLGAGVISVFYNPSMSKSLFQSVIAHEYHHSTWTEKYADNYEWDLLGSVIFEGKAEYFASEVFREPVVANSISTAEEKELWDNVKDSLDSTNSFKVNEVLLGGVNGLPYNYGYILGYKIVHEYVENNPNIDIEEWSKLSPEELYEKSGYGDSL